MSPEATFTAGTVVGPAWSARVPVPEGEQRHTHSDGGAMGSCLFLTAWLAIMPGYSPGEVWYTLSGPNIRQDGTPGARTLSRRVDRAEAEKTYPGAMEVAKLMLADGAKRVITHAEAVSAEIIRAITGEPS